MAVLSRWGYRCHGARQDVGGDLGSDHSSGRAASAAGKARPVTAGSSDGAAATLRVT